MMSSENYRYEEESRFGSVWLDLKTTRSPSDGGVETKGEERMKKEKKKHVAAVCVCVNKKPRRRERNRLPLFFFRLPIASHAAVFLFFIPLAFFFAVYPARLQHHPHTSSRRQGGGFYGRIDIAAGICSKR